MSNGIPGAFLYPQLYKLGEKFTNIIELLPLAIQGLKIIILATRNDPNFRKSYHSLPVRRGAVPLRGQFARPIKLTGQNQSRCAIRSSHASASTDLARESLKRIYFSTNRETSWGLFLPRLPPSRLALPLAEIHSASSRRRSFVQHRSAYYAFYYKPSLTSASLQIRTRIVDGSQNSLHPHDGRADEAHFIVYSREPRRGHTFFHQRPSRRLAR